MASQATFTKMQDGTLEDWMVIGAAHQQEFKNTADRFIGPLKSLEQHTLGFACDQLQHSLMTGTLARRDGASDEEVVIALCHDIGKSINVPNHGPIAAEMMRPYISDSSVSCDTQSPSVSGRALLSLYGRTDRSSETMDR